MKPGIHPEYPVAKISCACGAAYDMHSTKGSFSVEVCSNCHPFYTGKQKMLDTKGRVDKFRKKYGVKEETAKLPARREASRAALETSSRRPSVLSAALDLSDRRQHAPGPMQLDRCRSVVLVSLLALGACGEQEGPPDPTPGSPGGFAGSKAGAAGAPAGGAGVGGVAGASGGAGASGVAGASGGAGKGVSGASGSAGNGSAGTAGTSGSAGTAGTSGSAGTAGTSGSAGTAGVAGTAGASGASGAAGASGGGGSPTFFAVASCDFATAADKTGDTAVTIVIPAGGFSYSPACIKVKKGAVVTFPQTTQHPLRGMVQNGTQPNPITAAQATGPTTIPVTFTEVGSYGFHCDVHGADQPAGTSGMSGAVYVVE